MLPTGKDGGSTGRVGCCLLVDAGPTFALVQDAPTIGDVPSAVRERRGGPRLAVAQRVSRTTWIRVGILAAFCLFYIWTSATSSPIRFTSGADGVHGQIADAFLHGRLDLGDAPPGLSDLPNPFDPKQNGQDQPAEHTQFGGWAVHDLSLYKDRLYAYWGPVPALVLFAPARLLGFAFSESLAIALFGFLTFLFATLALLALQRRFAPDAPAWKVNAAIVCLGMANALPCVIRRADGPGQYQVTIAAGACFALLATWLVVTALLAPDARQRPDLRRLAGASLALGLAVGARPSHLVTAAGLLALVGWWLRATSRPQRQRAAVALLAPLAFCGVLLVLYNVARFGSPTEFGLSYQLAKVDVTARDTFSPSYLLPGLWYYLAAPPRLGLVFPFLQLPLSPTYPGHVPSVYDGVEPIGGLLVLAPIVLVMLVVPFRKRVDVELRAVLLTLLGITAGLVVIASVAFWGATMRYEVDFASLLLIGALTVWLGSRTRWATIAGTAAIAWASIAGLALSYGGGKSSLAATHPDLWQTLAEGFSPASRLVTSVTHGGPAIAEAQGNAFFDRKQQNYGSFGDQGISLTLAPAYVDLIVVMPSAGEAHLRARVRPGPAAVPGARLVLLVQRPDGTTEPVDITGPDLDVPLQLDGGVQKLRLAPWSDAPPRGLRLLRVRDLRVEGS